MSGVITNPAELDRLIQMAAAAGPDAIGTLTLLRAVRRGEIALQIASPSLSAGAFKLFARTNAEVPAIILLGDDGGESVGPDGFPVAQRVVEWARAAMIHAAAAEEGHYRAAIAQAQLRRRLVLIECGTSTLDAWIRLVQPTRIPSLIIRPINGQHPISPREAGETLH
ncbi:MAG: hypothetical protein AB7K73_16600 [Gammaproteobacteria bacterium]